MAETHANGAICTIWKTAFGADAELRSSVVLHKLEEYAFQRPLHFLSFNLSDVSGDGHVAAQLLVAIHLTNSPITMRQVTSFV